MVLLITLSSLLIFGLIIFTPFLILKILNKRKSRAKGFKFFAIGTFILLLLMTSFAAWNDYSDMILLKHYGYDFYELHVTGHEFDNVLPENREEVKSLIRSVSGIGWPLKAIFGYVYILPYLLLVFIIGKFIWKNNRNTEIAASK